MPSRDRLVQEGLVDSIMMLSEYGYSILETESYKEHTAPSVYLVGVDEYGYIAYWSRPTHAYDAVPIYLGISLGIDIELHSVMIAPWPFEQVENDYEWNKKDQNQCTTFNPLQTESPDGWTKLVPEKFGYINNPNFHTPATSNHNPCGYWYYTNTNEDPQVPSFGIVPDKLNIDVITDRNWAATVREDILDEENYAWYKGGQVRVSAIEPFQVPTSSDDPDALDIKTVETKFGYENNPFFTEEATAQHFPCGRWYYNPQDVIRIYYLRTLVTHYQAPHGYTLNYKCGPGIDYQLFGLDFLCVNLAKRDGQLDPELLPDKYAYFDEVGERTVLDEISPAWFIRLPLQIYATMRCFEYVSLWYMPNYPVVQMCRQRPDIVYEAVVGASIDASKIQIFRLNIVTKQLEATVIIDLGFSVNAIASVVTTVCGVVITTFESVVIYLNDDFQHILIDTTAKDYAYPEVSKMSRAAAVKSGDEYVYVRISLRLNRDLAVATYWAKINAITAELVSSNIGRKNDITWFSGETNCIYIPGSDMMYMQYDYHPAYGPMGIFWSTSVDQDALAIDYADADGAENMHLAEGPIVDGIPYMYVMAYQAVLFETGISVAKYGPLAIGAKAAIPCPTYRILGYYPPGRPTEGTVPNLGFDGGQWISYNAWTDSLVMLGFRDSQQGLDYTKFDRFNKFLKLDGDELNYDFAEGINGYVKMYYPRDPTWPFEVQQVKLGYVNNPRWRYPATKDHFPCGYWPMMCKRKLEE